ncbi:MAG: hypothetical protein AAF560_07115 [Acidobacteriota bacterium]
MASTLTLDDIHFVDFLPRYPSLIRYPLNQGLQLEPALKGPDGIWPQEFDIVFELRETDTTRFVVQPDGSFLLRRIDGKEKPETPWSVTIDHHRRIVLRWTDRLDKPPTEVLRLDCINENGVLLHLYLAIVEPLPPELRDNPELKPQTVNQPPRFTMMEDSEGRLVYTIFEDSARVQLPPKIQLELALRIQAGDEVQFEISLESTGRHFKPPEAGQDEVGVTLYAGESESTFLRPTLRPDPTTCCVTWLQTSVGLGPVRRFLAFNLAIKPDRDFESIAEGTSVFQGGRRRIDPTVIEDPYIPPVA